MIEPMKKISFFIFFRERKKILFHLQKLGLFHLEIKEKTISPKFTRLEKMKERYAGVLTELSKFKNNAAIAREIPVSVRSIKLKLQYLEDLFTLQKNLENALVELNANKKRLEPWGNFSWQSVAELERNGIKTRFHIGSAKVFEMYDFDGVPAIPLHFERGNVYFVTFEYKTIKTFPFEEVRLPVRSLAETEDEIRIITSDIEENRKDMEGYAAYIPWLKKEIGVADANLGFEQAKTGLEPHKSMLVYQAEGFFPASGEKKVKEYLDKYSISYIISDPEPGDNIPVLLRNSLFGKLFEPITRIFSLPDYFELDPTPFFAPFFTIFFGLCLGDAGYGLLLVLLSAALLFSQDKPLMKQIAALGILLGLATAVSGVFTNSFFGETLFTVPNGGPGLIDQGGGIAFFSSYTLNGQSVFPVMVLALGLGYMQIITGLILQAVNRGRQYGMIMILMPLGSILMILGGTVYAVHHDFLNLGFNADFTIGPVPIGKMIHALPPVTGAITGLAGMLLFFFFGHPDQSFLLRPLTGLWDFYGFVTGLLGDLLSYIRLFALGLAGGLLGNSFNHIAFMVLPAGSDGPDFHSPMMIVAVIILVAGHGLNLILSLLGSFVHPLRLTFVEFYKNIQFKGGGRSYQPFAIRK